MAAKTKRLKNVIMEYDELGVVLSFPILKINIRITTREAAALRDWLNAELPAKRCHMYDSQIICKSNLTHICTQPYWENCQHGRKWKGEK
ncbi:hypothetical protein [Sulfuricurvum sp.]|uniref:hypothetical protein n=1 Tax=Sulfuricurvum sp. TaxID=2025608 RepID=UPI0035694088